MLQKIKFYYLKVLEVVMAFSHLPFSFLYRHNKKPKMSTKKQYISCNVGMDISVLNVEIFSSFLKKKKTNNRNWQLSARLHWFMRFALIAFF